MSSAGSHIALVRKLFPDWAAEVSRLANRRDDFRAVCEEYGTAVEALECLERPNHPLDLERMREYRTTIREVRPARLSDVHHCHIKLILF